MFWFLTVFIFSANAVFAQNSETADWSNLFPEIAGCVRIIEPLKQNGKIFEQTAIYERLDFETRKDKDPNYFGCGSITLRFEPAARKSASINYTNLVNFPIYFPPQKQIVKNFDAYSRSPQCGNDSWIGSTDVYFDKDMVLTVSENMGGGILEFAESADYKLLKKTIGKFVKNKN